jgi:hypothetical protein
VYAKLGILFNQEPLTGQAGYIFDRNMVKLEQTTAQPYWEKIEHPNFSFIGAGANVFYRMDNGYKGTQSIGNLQDRLNLGYTIIDSTRREQSLPIFKTDPMHKP